MRKRALFTMVFAWLAIGCVPLSGAESVSKIIVPEAKIFLQGWNLAGVTRTLRPEGTRAAARIFTEVRGEDEVGKLISWLRLSDMVANPERDEDGKFVERNALLVIDILDDNGINSTYVSDGCFLYTLDRSKRRGVDAEFRHKFHFGETEIFFEPLGSPLRTGRNVPYVDCQKGLTVLPTSK